MPDHHRAEFGEAVKRVLASHGLSLRSQRIRTGIDHMTMKSMCDGLVPRLEKVEQFANAFGLDVNEWRALAGYEPLPASSPTTGQEVWDAGVRAFAQRTGCPAPRALFSVGSESLTVSRAHQQLADLWREWEEDPASFRPAPTSTSTPDLIAEAFLEDGKRASRK